MMPTQSVEQPLILRVAQLCFSVATDPTSPLPAQVGVEIGFDVTSESTLQIPLMGMEY
jgi:hypothetical protein